MPKAIPPGYKTCRTCHTAKPWAEFPSRPRNRDGLYALCSACTLKRDQDAAANKEATVRLRLAAGRKRCAKCGQVRGLEYFTETPGHGDGYRTRCDDCWERPSAGGHGDFGPLPRDHVACAVEVTRRRAVIDREHWEADQAMRQSELDWTMDAWDTRRGHMADNPCHVSRGAAQMTTGSRGRLYA